MLTIITKYWRGIIIFFLACAFFLGASSFNYLTQKDNFIKWLSPDETANYTFTKLYAQEGRLYFFEKYNLYANDIIHPRSVRSDYGEIKPVSFLGIILIYGSIAKFLGYKVIPYLTPFFGAVGIIFFYLLIKRIFNSRVALPSAFFLASFPVYIFYSARSMFHNVLFVDLFIAGLYFGALIFSRHFPNLSSPPSPSLSPERGGNAFSPSFSKEGSGVVPLGESEKKKRSSDFKGMACAALSGLFIGLAIITRASELIWITPLLLLLYIFNIRKIGFIKLMIFLSFLFLAFLPAIYYNQILYGSPWFTGYGEMNQVISDLINIKASAPDVVSSPAAIHVSIFVQAKLFFLNYFQKVKNFIFYFGWNPHQALKMAYYYFIKMFAWLFWPSAFAFLLIWKKEARWKLPFYFFCLALVSAILIFYYGSWKFNDNPDPNQFTIGNSYTRYWLPMYLGAMPLAAMTIIFSARLFFFYILDKRWGRIFVNGIIAAVVFVIIASSLNFVLFGSDEGLFALYYKRKETQTEFTKTIGLTEKNAVIITLYHDKVFFPERKVIVGLFDDQNMINEYAKLIKYLPVYYYNFTFPAPAVKYLNAKKLFASGIRIAPVKKISKDFTLYKLEKK